MAFQVTYSLLVLEVLLWQEGHASRLVRCIVHTVCPFHYAAAPGSLGRHFFGLYGAGI